LTLSELKHAASFADRNGVPWEEIADARSMADSWGDLKQAYGLAADGVSSAAEILIMGAQEYRQEERNQQTALKLEEQFSAEAGDAMDLFDGICDGNWGCVRKALRDQEQTQSEGLSEKGNQTLLQIAIKYGPSEGEIKLIHEGPCEEDWACTRAYFRDLHMGDKENGKPDKPPGKPE
jgi:hypothetical protein